MSSKNLRASLDGDGLQRRHGCSHHQNVFRPDSPSVNIVQGYKTFGQQTRPETRVTAKAISAITSAPRIAAHPPQFAPCGPASARCFRFDFRRVNRGKNAEQETRSQRQSPE